MYAREVLSNGIRLLTVPSRDTRALTLLVLVGVGSRHEPARLGGVSHFIEHMLFKGTKRWKTSSRMTRELDAVGADYNAFTSKEYTGFYIRVQADKASVAIEMLHEMIARPLFTEAEMERERGVILEEIAMYEDMPSAHASEMLDELLYTCPIGRNIAGTRKTVGTLSREELVKFWKTHYEPSQIVIAAAGDVEDDIIHQVRESFGSIPKVKKRKRTIPCAHMPKGTPRLEMQKRETEQVQFALGLIGLPYGDRLRPAMMVMATILGGGMSSRLFSEVREKRGLAYSIYASASSYHDAGDFTIHAGLAKEKAETGIRTVMQELGKMARSGVKPSELKRAKAYIEGKLVLGLESTHELAEFYAKQELLRGEIHSVEDRIHAIKAVTAEDVMKVGRRILRTNAISATLVGPFDDEKKFKKLLKIPYV